MQFDPRELRNAFGSFMTGVTVVTAINEEGEPVGFTANSFSSVSMDPPLISVCPAKSLSSFSAFKNATHFAINILAEGQENISNIFASAVEDRFSKVNWHKDENGTPILSDVLCVFSCQQHQNVNAGDHIIMIGAVQNFDLKEGQGLGYGGGSYFSLGLEREASSIKTSEEKARVGLLIERKGKVLFTIDADGKLGLPSVAIKMGENAIEAAESFLETNKLNATIGTVFSIFDNKNTNGRYTYYRCELNKKLESSEGYKMLSLQKALKDESFESDIKSMLERYLFENTTGVYGIYVGDHEHGKIHTIA